MATTPHQDFDHAGALLSIVQSATDGNGEVTWIKYRFDDMSLYLTRTVPPSGNHCRFHVTSWIQNTNHLEWMCASLFGPTVNLQDMSNHLRAVTARLLDKQKAEIIYPAMTMDPGMLDSFITLEISIESSKGIVNGIHDRSAHLVQKAYSHAQNCTIEIVATLHDIDMEAYE